MIGPILGIFSLVLVVVLGPLGTFADPTKKDSLSQFFQFEQNLPKAICDERMRGRAPALPVGGEQKEWQVLNTEFDVRELQIIQFLMNDRETMIARAGLLAEYESKKEAGLMAYQAQISLELCRALVTPGKLTELLQSRPHLFFELTEKKKSKPLNRSRFTVQDMENRFASDGKTWRGVGWIQPHEVLTAQSVSRRRYRRVMNLISHQLKIVIVESNHGFPLGFLYPTSDRVPIDWETLHAQASSQTHRSKQVDTYRHLIENRSLRALKRNPKKHNEFKKLLDFYKSLLQAYRLMPDDVKFKTYESGSGPKPVRTQAALDASFFEVLLKSKVNGVKIAFGLFEPDPKLHAIWNEFKSKLSELEKD